MSYQEAISVIEQLYDRDVRVELMLASRPEVRRAIIGSLKGVEQLTKMDHEAAGQAVLEFFERDEVQNDDELVGVALYLLETMPSQRAVEPLARYLRSGKLSGMNSELAAQAFLTNAGIEVVGEDPVLAALKAAENYGESQSDSV